MVPGTHGEGLPHDRFCRFHFSGWPLQQSFWNTIPSVLPENLSHLPSTDLSGGWDRLLPKLEQAPGTRCGHGSGSG